MKTRKIAVATLAAISIIAVSVSVFLGVNLYKANREIEANKYHFTSACEFDREGQGGTFLLTCEEVYEEEVNGIYRNCLDTDDVDYCVGVEMGWYE